MSLFLNILFSLGMQNCRPACRPLPTFVCLAISVSNVANTCLSGATRVERWLYHRANAYYRLFAATRPLQPTWQVLAPKLPVFIQQFQGKLQGEPVIQRQRCLANHIQFLFSPLGRRGIMGTLNPYPPGVCHPPPLTGTSTGHVSSQVRTGFR